MGIPAKRRTSPSQDCIEWDDQGDLQDPRQLADPSFCEERPSPDSATDNLTPIIPRKRRRKPLVGLRPAVSTTADTASGADDDAASSFHRMLFLKSSGQSPAAAAAGKMSSAEHPIKTDQELEENRPERKNQAISTAADDDDDDKFFADFTPEELAKLDQTASSGPPDPCSTNSIHSSSHPPPLREANVPSTNQASAHNNKTPTMRPPVKVSQPLQPIAPLPTQTPNPLVKIQEPKLPPVTTKHNIPFDDDDDDSFPDIDPDEAARKFRAATSQPEDTTKPNDTTTTQLDDLFDDDWNEETLSALEDAALGLEFTRYRVLAVTPERRCTQLTLATWTTEMLREENQNLRNLHHPSEATRDKKQVWPVAGICSLEGAWSQTNVRAGDIIHLCSLLGRTKTDELPKTVGGLDDLVIIVHPDILLAPTIISEGIACPRRAVLKSRIGSTGLTTKSALFGTLRHSVFEEAMKHQNFSRPFLSKYIVRLVREKAEELISCDVTSKETEQELYKVIPMLQKFANRHTLFGNNTTKRQGMPLENYLSSKPPSHFLATEAEAVEEPIVCPELGLKGNVDMIAKASTGMFHPERLMGIELKTSHRQTIRSEHTAQLLLYVLMMQTHHGKNAAESGVLLYLNNEDLRALHILYDLESAKQLLSVRNQVAIGQVLAGTVNDADTNEPATKECSPPIELPDLIHDNFACKKCYSNRECYTYNATKHLADKDPSEIGAAFTSHLERDELEYFLKWDRLINLEVNAEDSSIARAWLLGPEEVEDGFTACMSSLMLDIEKSKFPDVDVNDRGGWQYVAYFSRNLSGPSVDSLSTGTRVILSMDTTTLNLANKKRWKTKFRPQMHIARGDICDSSSERIGMQVSRDDLLRINKLAKKTMPYDVHFRIDRDHGATGVGTLRQNLINLLTGDKKTNSEPGTTVEGSRLPRLRELLLKLHPPKFDDDWKVDMMFQRSLSRELPCQIPSCDLALLGKEFDTLNSDQQSAVRKVFSANDYTLIQGLPGTGKTSTITFIVKLLVAHNKRVLITSYTHSAVDNVLLKLIDGGMVNTDGNLSACPIARIDRYARCHARVKSYIAEKLATEAEGNCEHVPPSAEALRKVISAAKVVGVSALTIPRSSLLINQHFDVVIVDEAGQISQPAIIGALMAAKTFVLVGDQMQLPPIAISELSSEKGFCVSMMQRLAESNSGAVAQLGLQYRMHEEICRLSNDIVYKGALKCANASVAKQQAQLFEFPTGIKTDSIQRPWLEKTLCPSTAVIFVNTDGPCQSSFCPLENRCALAGTTGIVNTTEASLVRVLVDSLLLCGILESNIGIIVPFRAQLKLLNNDSAFLPWKEAGLEMSTIDSYQGRDKLVIVISFTRSNAKGKVGRLLEDFRRLNVAVTRAKCKLIMVGSYSTLSKGSTVLGPILHRLKNSNMVVDIPSVEA